MKKITLLMLPLLLVTMVSCGLKDTLWNENSDVSLNLEKNILQQVNRNVFADKKAEETDESKVVNFVCTISGDYSNTQTQPVDFANEVNTVTFTFENLPVGGIIDVEMILILESTGDELYRGKTESVKVLSNNATKVQIRLSKASEKLKDLFYPKTVFDGKWVTSKKNVVTDNNGLLYVFDDKDLSNSKFKSIYQGPIQGAQVFDYCFDENGDVFHFYYNSGCVFLYKGESTGGSLLPGDFQQHTPSNPDFPLYFGTSEVKGLSDYNFKIAYDKVTRKLYVLGSAWYDNTNHYALACYDVETQSFSKMADLPDIEMFTSIAAHDNYLYVATYGDDDNKIIKYKYSDKAFTVEKEVNLFTALQVDENQKPYFEITDMEIQSDLLFATYRVNDDKNGTFIPGVYNYGGVLIFSLGELSQIVSKGSFKSGLGSIGNARKISLSDRYLCYDYNGWPQFSIKGEQDETLYSSVLITPKLSFYTPDSYDSKIQFFGPQQIVAIKPKKLVILDKGVFLYVEGGSPKAKEIARLVELDIEKLVFDEQTDISFGNFKDCAELYKVSYLADKELEGYYLDLYCGVMKEGTAYLNQAYNGETDPTLFIEFNNVDIY